MSESTGRDVHDLGGEIGPADAAAGEGDADRPQPHVDLSAMAVDSTPDQVRAGTHNQDETEMVQMQEEYRPVPRDEE